MSEFHKIFKCERHDEIIVVVPQGDALGFRYADVHVESNAVAQVLNQSDVMHLVVDFGLVDLIGSIIIGSILKFARSITHRGGKVAFCNASEQMLDVLNTMNLGNLWPYLPTREEAFRSVRA